MENRHRRVFKALVSTGVSLATLEADNFRAARSRLRQPGLR